MLEITGKGVYVGFRTFEGSRVYLWGAHALRLETGRAAAGLPDPVNLQALGGRVAQVLDQLWSDHPGIERKVRIDLAETDLRGLDPRGAGCRLVLQAWPLQGVDPSLLAAGVECALETRLSRPRPQIKDTPFSLTRMRTRFPSGANYESLLVDPDGTLLEGVMSGLAFVQGDVLRTAGPGALPSITLASLCGLAEDRGLRVQRQAVRLDELASMDEAFLASSVRNVVPVVRIGDQTIGSGAPGPHTRALLQEHAERMRAGAIRTDHTIASEPTARSKD